MVYHGLEARGSYRRYAKRAMKETLIALIFKSEIEIPKSEIKIISAISPVLPVTILTFAGMLLL